MQATARRLSVVSATSCARRRLIRDVRIKFMSIFRRETSKGWLQCISVFFPIFWIGLTLLLHCLVNHLFLTTILGLAGIILIIMCFRLFTKAEKMMIEVFSDRIDWLSFLATPAKASIPMDLIKEIIVYKTRSNQLVPTSLSLMLVDGQVLGIPNPTGSYLPILEAIRQVKPDVFESIRIGMSPEQREILWKLITWRD
jgi:hypothetical protein